MNDRILLIEVLRELADGMNEDLHSAYKCAGPKHSYYEIGSSICTVAGMVLDRMMRDAKDAFYREERNGPSKEE